ncbi:MAG TPA: hypothetical protein VFI31_12920 [Pirellulales bacterium]|nr:hypothetical protein [Pirellulales bacterium]
MSVYHWRSLGESGPLARNLRAEGNRRANVARQKLRRQPDDGYAALRELQASESSEQRLC